MSMLYNRDNQSGLIGATVSSTFMSIRMERSIHGMARVTLENAEFVILTIFRHTLSSAYVNILFGLWESNNWAINHGNNMLHHSLELVYCSSNFKASAIYFDPRTFVTHFPNHAQKHQQNQ